MILNQKAFDCQHGKDRNIHKKDKSAEINDKKNGNFLIAILHSSKFTRGLNENLLLLKDCNCDKKLNRERRWRRRKKKFIYLFKPNFWGMSFCSWL